MDQKFFQNLYENNFIYQTNRSMTSEGKIPYVCTFDEYIKNLKRKRIYNIF